MLALFVGLFVDQVVDQITLRDLSARMRVLASPGAGAGADARAGATTILSK